MTLKEKREKVKNYCVCTACSICELNNKKWEHTCGGDSDCYTCLNISTATEKELDRALELIAGETCVEPEPCIEPEPCVLEQVAEDADTVIKIKSNRKINRLIIEFAEEVKA